MDAAAVDDGGVAESAAQLLDEAGAELVDGDPPERRPAQVSPARHGAGLDARSAERTRRDGLDERARGPERDEGRGLVRMGPLPHDHEGDGLHERILAERLTQRVRARAVGVDDDDVGGERAGQIDRAGTILCALDLIGDTRAIERERVGEQRRPHDERGRRRLRLGLTLAGRVASGPCWRGALGPGGCVRETGATRQRRVPAGAHGNLSPGERGQLVEDRAEPRDLVGRDLASHGGGMEERFAFREARRQPVEPEQPRPRRQPMHAPPQIVPQPRGFGVGRELPRERGELGDPAPQLRDEVRSCAAEHPQRMRTRRPLGGPSVPSFLGERRALPRGNQDVVQERLVAELEGLQGGRGGGALIVNGVLACHRPCRNTGLRSSPNLRREESAGGTARGAAEQALCCSRKASGALR